MGPIEGLSFINIDKELCIRFKDISTEPYFSLKAKDYIATYISKNVSNSSPYGKHVAISDIGILLEKELRFDFIAFLDKYSQNQTLFLKWDGEIIDNKLYFLTKKNGIEIDISDLSHIIL